MFDTIVGLPLHPLVLHAVVVLAPLTALLLAVYALVPRWRPGLRWPTVLLAAVTAVAAWVTQEAGEALAQRVGNPDFGHEEAGELAARSVIALLVVTLLVVFVLARARAAKTGGSWRNILGVVLALIAAGFCVYAVTLAGHSGSQSVWQEIMTPATPAGATAGE